MSSATVSPSSVCDVPMARDRVVPGSPPLAWMILGATLVYLLFSSFRHYVLRSGAFDLGFFDQALWLISRGETPISSLRDIHVLADHASLILYPLASLYLIWPDPHMLLAVQALILALGAIPIRRLALGAGLSERQSLAMAAAYLMFPFVLTANLFDFHPETIAMPAILMAILAAREDKRVQFCIWIALVLASKEVLALIVVMMGVWLLLAERRRFAGTVALVAGAVWFVIALKFIIPYFGAGRAPSGLNYYSYLGGSIEQIIKTMITQPQVVLGRVFSADGLKYLAILVAPAIWALHPRALAPLIACLPVILMNVLSEHAPLRSPFYQYSVTTVPFFFMAMILAVAAGLSWWRQPRYIVGWAVLLLVAGLGMRLRRMETAQAAQWDAIQHTRDAIERVPDGATLLTTFEVFPHVSRRSLVHYVGGHELTDHLPLHEYDAVLFNVEHRSMDYFESWVDSTIQTLRANPDFKLAYEKPDVVLFVKSNPEGPAAGMARTDERQEN